MNEVYRILKPGGIFLSCTPINPYASSLRDPTHINFITTETFPLYFDDKSMWGVGYGFKGKFEVMNQYLKKPHLISVFKKI